MISYSEAKMLSKKGNVVPLFERIPADLDTPVSAYIKLARNKKFSFLLESIEGGEKIARYSFLGFDPFLIVEPDADGVCVTKGKTSSKLGVPPIDFVRELFSFYRPIRVEGLPRFTGGGVGYFAYDTVRWVEDIPDQNENQIDLPDMRFGFYSRIVAFDHLKQEIVVIANILHESGEKGFKKKYDAATADLKNMIKKLQSTLLRQINDKHPKPKIESSYSKSEFSSMVRKAKKYIKEGDIFQVVLSQRWRLKSKKEPLEVYRRLRRINPSPYMFLLKFPDSSIIGASPEMMVRIEGGVAETRPIAGTRRRGKTEREDNTLIQDLMTDAKELAEHTMLLDLGRNDIGRVSKPGTVRVKDNMVIEKYSHVIHIVSSVVGELAKGASPIEGHFACFPAGTVSGAPKIRAMEIIDELEKLRRGVYAGSIAYLDFWGNLDSCIAIRTMVRKDGEYYVQAGAGIVADSKPAREFDETRDKARALIDAIAGDD